MAHAESRHAEGTAASFFFFLILPFLLSSCCLREPCVKAMLCHGRAPAACASAYSSGAWPVLQCNVPQRKQGSVLPQPWFLSLVSSDCTVGNAFWLVPDLVGGGCGGVWMLLRCLMIWCYTLNTFFFLFKIHFRSPCGRFSWQIW